MHVSDILGSCEAEFVHQMHGFDRNRSPMVELVRLAQECGTLDGGRVACVRLAQIAPPGSPWIVKRRVSREDRADIDDPEVVLAAAARFLEVRPRSISEVRRRLTSAGYRSALVDGAIARLTDLGILDDEAFARAWVESRDRARPRGERALRQELALKGVGREIVDGILAERRSAAREAQASEPDEAAARALIDRNARALERVVDLRARRQKAYALLARNGFDPDIAGRVASAFVSADDTPEAAYPTPSCAAHRSIYAHVEPDGAAHFERASCQNSRG